MIKPMKKNLCLLLLLLIPLLFTSCIDYVQSITYKDGKYQIYYKITLSKLLFAMADDDPEEIFEYFDEESLEDFPENVDVKPVNTDLEVGAEFLLLIDPKTTDETEKSFLPKLAGQKCYISFLFGREDFSFADFMKSDDSESQAISEAILSSAKCRVMVSKKIISSINNAYFEGRGGQNYSVAVFDYGESFCMEIPFIVLFESGMYKFDRIVVIRE